MELLTEGIIVVRCEEGIKQLLFNAFKLGKQNLKP